MAHPIPQKAMVLAAGRGERMRPLTATMPKPLVRVAGRPLLDHVLDKLDQAGVQTAIVNVHYLADQIEKHLADRTSPRIVISDERDLLLETGGGTVKALPLLGDEPFFLVNSDTIWLDGVDGNWQRLAEAFDAQRMDALLLLAASTNSIGYAGRGDFTMATDGRLQPRAERQVAPFVYAGAAMFSPRLFEDAPQGPFSLNRLFAKASESDRLFGLRLDGLWMHVGTPDAIALAEDAILQSAA